MRTRSSDSAIAGSAVGSGPPVSPGPAGRPSRNAPLPALASVHGSIRSKNSFRAVRAWSTRLRARLPIRFRRPWAVTDAGTPVSAALIEARIPFPPRSMRLSARNIPARVVSAPRRVVAASSM